MCLLIAIRGVIPGLPLVVAANRDEWLARPATSMTVLEDGPPRILGGRDEVAGGTWLALNERGVFAALTNLPAARDPSKRSRGELPLLLARHVSASEAAADFAAKVRGEDYSRCWLLTGDRESLHYIDLTAPGAPSPRALGAGVFVLENKPIDAPSAKADAVGARVERHLSKRGDDLVRGLYEVLGDPTRPEGSPPQQAACVHGGEYGTRSSAIALVPEAIEAPRLFYTDGPPCTNPLVEATSLFDRRADR